MTSPWILRNVTSDIENVDAEVVARMKLRDDICFWNCLYKICIPRISRISLTMYFSTHFYFPPYRRKKYRYYKQTVDLIVHLIWFSLYGPIVIGCFS